MRNIFLCVFFSFTVTAVSCEFVDPYALIHPGRFDVMAKYIYANFREKKVASDFGLCLYREHLCIMNDFIEEDGRKNNFHDIN